MRTFFFTLFTLLEYVRSGRVFVDLTATVIFFYVFFLLGENRTVDDQYFFTLTSIFTMALTLYTMSAVMSLGDRPLCYVLLARKLGRSGYLLGLYFCAFFVVATNYLLISLAARVVNPVQDLTFLGWVIGSIPLLLNVGLFVALLLMLSPLVFSTGWRLFLLSLFALAFSGNFLTGPVRNAMPEILQHILSSLQTILSWPLVPAFSGFALSLNREVSVYALVVFIAQLSLLIALLSLSLFSFSRREIIFVGE